MSVNTPNDVPRHMLKDDVITKFGVFIRKTSIDELPEPWSISIGSMSAIGARDIIAMGFRLGYGI